MREIMREVIERIVIERNKKVDSLILGEIQKIATENGIDTKIVLNEKAVVNALEKQIPKKPIIKYGDDTITHNLGRLMCFHCPNCGKYIVALYETDVENGAGIHKDLKGCSTCLQAIDFTGYYHIDKLDEEIALE